MQFQLFYKRIKEIRPIFTKEDLNVIFPTEPVTSRQLSRWQEQKHIIKLKNGVYVLEDFKNSVHPFLVANILYYPSYVSLESALYEHGFIPDVPQAITSISTKKTWSVKIYLGDYSYKKIKKECFVGYAPTTYLGREVLLAEPEKAIVDFFYFYKSRLRKSKQIDELRLNYFNLKQKINKEKMTHYGFLFNSKLLDRLLADLVNKF